MKAEIAGEALTLLPERAIYWERRETLLVADPHWGKAATMRAARIPVPGGTTTESLARLTRVVEKTAAKRIVLLGDALHARAGRADQTMAALIEWRARYQEVEMVLVRGNHDHRAGDPPRELAIECVNAPMHEAPFVYRHFPGPSEDGYTLAGHLHPALRLRGMAAERATLACFWFQERVGVLPAFGGLTGMAKIKPEDGDRVWVVAGDEVVRV